MNREKFYSKEFNSKGLLDKYNQAVAEGKVVDSVSTIGEMKLNIANERRKIVRKYLILGWEIEGGEGNYFIVGPSGKKYDIYEDFEAGQLLPDINTQYQYDLEVSKDPKLLKEAWTAKGLTKLVRKIPEGVRTCLVKNSESISINFLRGFNKFFSDNQLYFQGKFAY